MGSLYDYDILLLFHLWSGGSVVPTHYPRLSYQFYYLLYHFPRIS